MDDYIPHQRYEFPTNKREEEYHEGDELHEFDYIYRIHEDWNDDSYNGYIGAEV